MKVLKRALIAVAGGIVLLLGTAMIILPGPAILVIPAGLAILAVEFDWAQRWLAKIRDLRVKRHGDSAAPAADRDESSKPESGRGNPMAGR